MCRRDRLKDTPAIKNGYLEVPYGPGLGVTLDMDQVMEANKLYNRLPSHDRDDAMAMQYLDVYKRQVISLPEPSRHDPGQ